MANKTAIKAGKQNSQREKKMITLTPAYGRDYKSKKAILVDLKKNMDFILNDISSPWDGKPCSPNDFKGQAVKVRYKRNTMVFIHTQK